MIDFICVELMISQTHRWHLVYSNVLEFLRMLQNYRGVYKFSLNARFHLKKKKKMDIHIPIQDKVIFYIN